MEPDRAFLGLLAEAVRASRAALMPEVVLVASSPLRRDLARRLRERAGGFLDVRFLTFLDLARALARAELAEAPRPLLGPSGKLALARAALRRAQERRPGLALAPASPGFPAALAAVFDDLLEAGIDELRLPPRASRPVLHEIAALYQEFRGLLRGRALHPAQVLALAALRAAEFRRHFAAARLWMAGFYELNPSQLGLLEALARSGVEVLASMPFPSEPHGRFARPLRDALERMGARVIGPDPDAFSPGALGRLQASLFSPSRSPEGPAGETGGESLVLVSAPDEEREVREAARGALRLFEERGIPFHRMAVTFPASRKEVYLPLIDLLFAGAGLPHERRQLRDLAHEKQGRALRSLLEILGPEPPPRSLLMDLLAIEDGAASVETSRLDRLSRRGGISAWGGDWRLRLRTAARRRPGDGDEGELDPPGPSPDPALEAAIDRVGRILAALASFPRSGSWDALLEALDRVLAAGFPGLRGAEGVQAIARELRRLSDLEPETTLEAFRAAWGEELARAPAPVLEDVQGGVVVGDLMELRGLRFEAQFLLGAAERVFPAPPRPDPLLPDADRRALNAASASAARLPLKSDRIDEEELIFAGAVASTGSFLQISFPRLDLAAGRPSLPSLFFLRTLEAVLGRRVPAHEAESAPGVRRVGLTHGDLKLEEALDASEHHLAAAVAAAGKPGARLAARLSLGEISPSIERIARREEKRWEPRLTAEDGIVPAALLARLPDARISGAGGAISPTRLEAYAVCPHRYLHRSVLGLEPIEEPEVIFQMEPLDKGALVHRVLEKTYRALGKEGLLPVTQERLAAALGVLERESRLEFTRAERSLPVGLPVFWEALREDLLDSMQSILQSDADAEGAWKPLDFEVRFGMAPGPGGVVLEVPAPAGGAPPVRILLRGRIDRIDLGLTAGSFRIVDYKTGKLPEPPFAGGEAIQLPLYLLAGETLLAARGLRAAAECSEAAYVGLTGKSRTFSGVAFKETLEKLKLAAATVAAGVEGGTFFQRPGRDRTNCKHCDFKRVCDPRVETIAALKEGDPRAAAFAAMKEALANPRRGQGKGEA